MPYTIEKHGNVEYRVSVDADGFAVYEPAHADVMHAVPSAPSDMRVEG
ncbi:hypothetical protein [Komagataeibacter europaeus]